MKNVKNTKEVGIQPFRFKDEESGKVYEFKGYSFRHNGRVYTAEDAKGDPEVLAYLVSINSRIVKEIN